MESDRTPDEERAIRQENTLRFLDILQEAQRAVDAEVAEAVTEAREAGLSWQRIGAALGTSKQAAQQRFGVKDD